MSQAKLPLLNGILLAESSDFTEKITFAPVGDPAARAAPCLCFCVRRNADDVVYAHTEMQKPLFFP
jgi:hypothetical protein